MLFWATESVYEKGKASNDSIGSLSMWPGLVKFRLFGKKFKSMQF